MSNTENEEFYEGDSLTKDDLVDKDINQVVEAHKEKKVLPKEIVISLDYPVEYNKKTYEVVRFRIPRAKDLEHVSKLAKPQDQMKYSRMLLCHLAIEPEAIDPSFFGELVGSDWTACNEALMPFLVR